MNNVATSLKSSNSIEFEPSEIQVFITTFKLFSVRSSKSFETIYNTVPKVKIDGFITEQKKYDIDPENIYKKDFGIFIIDGLPYTAKFTNLSKVRNRFYISEDCEFCLMSIYELDIENPTDKIFDPVRSNDIVYPNRFSLVFNVKAPNIDVIAPRLIMDEQKKACDVNVIT